MSKRDLKKYLNELSKVQLEDQILELYHKFNDVKVYYDFVFNPKEDKLVQDAKVKISNEYFPIRGKKAKLRRSTSQKLIKHFIVLGVDSFIIADIMLYNIEVAQTYTSEKTINQELFYKSMLNSFEQLVNYIIEKGIFYEFKDRVVAAKNKTFTQNWYNKHLFNTIIERIE
jgi:hypothetical protein